MAERRDAQRSGFLPARVVHLHASRRCNLACRHCYSSSSPDEGSELSPAAIVLTLAILRAEGYGVLSLSGGEPLLYSGFDMVVRAAVDLGYRVNLITNGAPVGGKLLETIAEHISLVAVSLDGAPGTHNWLRGDMRAFSWAERGMQRLSEAGVRFGISYCVSKDSIKDMPWAVEFAAAKGAALVQFHPFAATGRGRHLDARLSLSETDKARAFVIAKLLEGRSGPAIKLDLTPLDAAFAQRFDYHILIHDGALNVPLSDLANPLVIGESGEVLPISYGINSRFRVGQLGSDLEASIEHYKACGWQDLRKLLESAFAHLNRCSGGYSDWFHHVVETSFSEASILNETE